MDLKYTNPRTVAVITDWPSGTKRVTAKFEIESNGRGERAIRTTFGAPKKLTYALKSRIVDGDDGRTYFVSIMRGDMQFQHETIHSNNPRYAAAMELFAADVSEVAPPRKDG
jgi:hypothetical protein